MFYPPFPIRVQVPALALVREQAPVLVQEPELEPEQVIPYVSRLMFCLYIKPIVQARVVMMLQAPVLVWY